MARYEMIYDQYDRGCSNQTTKEVFKAKSDKMALLIAHPWVSYGCGRFDKDDLDEEEIEEYKSMTEEDIVEAIDSCNGDGTDFLISLKNLDTNETLYQSECFEEYDSDGEEEVFDEEL